MVYMLGDSIVLYGRISLDNRMYENVSLAVFGLNEKNHTRYKIDIEKCTIFCPFLQIKLLENSA